MISANEALNRLTEGNHRFVADEATPESTASRKHRPGMAAAQSPFAIVLTCSDSRVPTEVVFDQGIGDLFVIRVAGNIAAPTQLGSIEYAAKVFGTPLVVVLGHSNCGAIAATMQEITAVSQVRSPNLRAIVDRIRPVLSPVISDHQDSDGADVMDACVRANVHASVQHLQYGSLALEEMITNGDLTVVGAEYSIETGKVEFLD